VVERTAHNGLVVGSNPTKPKIFMKFNSKNHKILKTENYLKNNNLFFFFSGINQNSNNWIKTEQGLKNMNFSYYKIFNRTSTKIFNNSIYKNNKFTINGIIFFIKPSYNDFQLSKKNILNLEKFIFLAFKLNNRIYSANQLKHSNFLNYYNNKLLLYQFSITNIKFYLNK
jgi:hypothetical protein